MEADLWPSESVGERSFVAKLNGHSSEFGAAPGFPPSLCCTVKDLRLWFSTAVFSTVSELVGIVTYLPIRYRYLG